MIENNDDFVFPALLILVDATVKAGADRVALADHFQRVAQAKRNEGFKDAAVALELLAGKADPDRYSSTKMPFDVIQGGKKGES
jgi:hypothetical protein